MQTDTAHAYLSAIGTAPRGTTPQGEGNVSRPSTRPAGPGGLRAVPFFRRRPGVGVGRCRPDSNRRLSRTLAASAALAALLLGGAGSASAFAQGLPGAAEISFGQRSVSLFLRYPDMATCEAAYYSNCYRFADGTVVGQFDPMLVFMPLVNLMGFPWGECHRLPQLGASAELVEVYAGAGVPLVVGSSGCNELKNDLAAGRAYLAVPGVRKTIPPTRATVLELDAARR